MGLGVNFDAGNAATFAADPLALLDEVIGRVVSVHASDSAVRGELRHVLLGTGVTPYPALFERLARAGWDGWICMEEASFQGRAGVEAAAGFVRQTWQEAQCAVGHPQPIAAPSTQIGKANIPMADRALVMGRRTDPREHANP